MVSLSNTINPLPSAPVRVNPPRLKVVPQVPLSQPGDIVQFGRDTQSIEVRLKESIKVNNSSTLNRDYENAARQGIENAFFSFPKWIQKEIVDLGLKIQICEQVSHISKNIEELYSPESTLR